MSVWNALPCCIYTFCFLMQNPSILWETETALSDKYPILSITRAVQPTAPVQL